MKPQKNNEILTAIQQGEKMKTLMVCLMGFVLVIFGLSFAPGLASAQQAAAKSDALQPRADDTTVILPMTDGECPPGKFDQSGGGRCKEPMKEMKSDLSKEILPMTNGECPPGKFDQSGGGRCKEPLKKIDDRLSRHVTVMSDGECPPGKFDQSGGGRCKEPLKSVTDEGDTSAAE